MEKTKGIIKNISSSKYTEQKRYEYKTLESTTHDIKIFNELGVNGWEFIGTDYYRSVEEMREIKIYIFKREIL